MGRGIKRPKSPPLPPTQEQLRAIQRHRKPPSEEPQDDKHTDQKEDTELQPQSKRTRAADEVSYQPQPASSSSAGAKQDPCPPRQYGYWMHGTGDARLKPWALIIFSGRSREGDLQHALCRLGWRVCAIDVVAPRPTNILCEATWESIRTDLVAGKFEALWIATPCETFSPLREKQPGPRVLRTLEHIQGLPKEGLTLAEQKQVKESNILVSRTASAASAQSVHNKPWGIENPDHGEDKPSLWLMPAIQKLVTEKADADTRFDQCMTGLATRKPTRLASKGISLHKLKDLRCNHPPQQQTRADGTVYQAPHASTVQQWVINSQGHRERASKSQGEYTTELSEILARAFHATQSGSTWLREELATAPIP